MSTNTEKQNLIFKVTSQTGSREEVIAQDIIKIGKDPKSHIQLTDENVSRMHAVIEVSRANEITLIDLGNEPGTYVNGSRVNKCKINVGDQIKIGETSIQLTSIGAVDTNVQPNTTGMADLERVSLAAPVSMQQIEPATPQKPAAVPPPVPTSTSGYGATNPFVSMPAANPFMAEAAVAVDTFQSKKHAKNQEFLYRLVKSGPEVPASEVERSDVLSVEVMVSWGETILNIEHLSPPRNYFVGEELEKSVHGYQLPSEKLGLKQLPLVAVVGSDIFVVVPSNATGSFETKTEGKINFAQAKNKGLVTPYGGVAGCEQIRLQQGSKVRIELNDFVFQVSAIAAGKKLVGTINKGNRAGVLFWLASAALHSGFVVALMMSPGASLDDESSPLDKSTQAYIMQLQKNAAEREIPEQEDTSQGQQQTTGGTGTKHKGAEGMMGDPSKQAANAHYQIKGPPDTQEVKLAKTRALIESANYGAIGALASVLGSTANAPIAFDSDSETSIGRDPNNYNGNLMGQNPGDSFGYNGLGLSGTGAGGGGFGDGIGLGTVGGFGHGSGTGSGQGFGGGGGRMGANYKPKAVKIIEMGTDIQGRLPPEVIRRIIRANFPRFRACYEQGLKRDPSLRGTVSVRFIIDTTGAVESASRNQGSLSDGQVADCVVGIYRTLSFPEPEGGKVLVTYPIDFQNDQ